MCGITPGPVPSGKLLAESIVTGQNAAELAPCTH
jgi:hypothetical protein